MKLGVSFRHEMARLGLLGRQFMITRRGKNPQFSLNRCLSNREGLTEIRRPEVETSQEDLVDLAKFIRMRGNTQ